MSVKKNPTDLLEELGLTNNPDSLQDYLASLDESEKPDYDRLGEEALLAYQAVMKGKVKLDSTQMAIVKDLISKIVPSAPKHVSHDKEIKPEEYIVNAMKSNENSFIKLRDRAEEYARMVEEKNKEFFTKVSENL